jgi:hypothetical protein
MASAPNGACAKRCISIWPIAGSADLVWTQRCRITVPSRRTVTPAPAKAGGRFCDSDLLRTLLETSVGRCMAEGLVGGESFAVDSSFIRADANRQRFDLDTGALPTQAVIMDVETTTVTRQAEVLAAKRMLDRTRTHFDMHPDKLIADTGYGSAEMLGWLVEERGIAPHIPVFDKSTRTDGIFSRVDFVFNPDDDSYTCPGGKLLRHYRRIFDPPHRGVDDEGQKRYRSSKYDCDVCALKPQCTPKEPARKILRSIHEPARDVAHLKRILKLDRLRLRGANGARDEFYLAAMAQSLHKLAKLIPGPPLQRHPEAKGLCNQTYIASIRSCWLSFSTEWAHGCLYKQYVRPEISAP